MVLPTVVLSGLQVLTDQGALQARAILRAKYAGASYSDANLYVLSDARMTGGWLNAEEVAEAAETRGQAIVVYEGATSLSALRVVSSKEQLNEARAGSDAAILSIPASMVDMLTPPGSYAPPAGSIPPGTISKASGSGGSANWVPLVILGGVVVLVTAAVAFWPSRRG